MRLYHVPNTRGSRVIWILEEAGVPYDLERISREQTQEPEHLARHPLGKVPVLEDDDGSFVFESAAHLLVVADVDPTGALIGPVGSHDRALAYQWMFFAVSELEPPILEVFRAKDGSDADKEAPTARLRAAVQAVESALEGHEYLIAERFGVADVIVSTMLLFARRVGLLEDSPNVAAYLERIEARPARKRALELASAPA